MEALHLVGITLGELENLDNIIVVIEEKKKMLTQLQ
jgi:hypothetical protein